MDDLPPEVAEYKRLRDESERVRRQTLALAWMLNAVRLQIKALMYAPKCPRRAEEITEDAEKFVVEAFGDIEKL